MEFLRVSVGLGLGLGLGLGRGGREGSLDIVERNATNMDSKTVEQQPYVVVTTRKKTYCGCRKRWQHSLSNTP